MIRIGIPKRSGPGGLRSGAWRAFAALSAAALAVSCIERSNPFDPLNAGDAKGAEIRSQLRPRLDSLAAGEPAYASALAGYDAVFRKDSADNARKISDNDARRDTNSALAKRNSAVAAANATAPLDSLGQQQFYGFLDTLRAYGKYPGLDTVPKAVSAQAAKLMAFLFQANADHAPAVVYPAPIIDSILRPFAQDSAAFVALQSRIDAGNRAVAAYNAAARADNLAWADANAKVADYNLSMAWLKETRNKPTYARADSLAIGTAAAQAGDTLLIAQGSYPADLRFNHSGTKDNPILVRGYPGGRTIIRAPSDAQTVLTLSSGQNIQFQDIVFRGGQGVQLVFQCQNIEFRRCVFDSCSSYGLRVTESGVSLVDCRLTGNGLGAFIQGKTDGSTPFSMKNVLIARNAGTGLVMTSPIGGIFNSTISDNGGSGIDLAVPHSAFNIYSSIISGNAGVGIYRHRDTEYQDKLDVSQCDVWGNKNIDWSLAGMDTVTADALRSRNFSIEPEFVDPANLGYDLRPGSVLAGFEHQTVPAVIGYRP
jgi:hypothetical protein